MFTSLQEEEGNLAVWHKFWRFWTSWQSSKIFSELKMIFNKFLLGLPPTKVNIDSELFSLGLTREMLTQEIIKFCIHYIFARLYYFLNFSFFWHNLIRRWIVMNHFQCWGSYNGRHKKKKNISFLNNSHSKAIGVFKYVESFKCIYCVFSWTDFLGWKGVC